MYLIYNEDIKYISNLDNCVYSLGKASSIKAKNFKIMCQEFSEHDKLLQAIFGISSHELFVFLFVCFSSCKAWLWGTKKENSKINRYSRSTVSKNHLLYSIRYASYKYIGLHRHLSNSMFEFLQLFKINFHFQLYTMNVIWIFLGHYLHYFILFHSFYWCLKSGLLIRIC